MGRPLSAYALAFFRELAENVLVNIGIVGYRNGLMRDRVIGA